MLYEVWVDFSIAFLSILAPKNKTFLNYPTLSYLASTCIYLACCDTNDDYLMTFKNTEILNEPHTLAGIMESKDESDLDHTLKEFAD